MSNIGVPAKVAVFTSKRQKLHQVVRDVPRYYPSDPGRKSGNYENNQQDALYRLIYYSMSALHVLGDVFAHHQEHLTVFTVSGSVHPSCCRLPAGSNLGEHYQILEIW